jgi:AraC-like DNA-binding protein
MQNKEIYEANFWRFSRDEELPLYPFCSEYSLRYLPRKTDFVLYPFLQICGIKEGSLRFIFQEKQYLLEAEDVLLIPPRTLFRFESFSTKGFYGKQVLEIKGSLLDDILENLNLNKICLFKKKLWQDFSKSFNQVNKLNSTGKLEDIPQINGAIFSLLHACSLKNETHQAKTDANVIAACHWIDEHLDVPLDLKQVETKLNISRSTLCRLFKNYKGMSPRSYWIRRRVERAEFLLLHSDFSIKEIAFQLGYSSQFHFSNEFSKFHDLSPLSYRKRGFV